MMGSISNVTLVCFPCRYTTKSDLDTGSHRRCPHCRQPLSNVGKKFKLPKKTDNKAWVASESFHRAQASEHDEPLHDSRAQPPTDTRLEADSPYSRYRLDRQPELIPIACRCGVSATLNRDMLIAQVGDDINVIHVARQMIPCGSRNKSDCKAYVVRE